MNFMDSYALSFWEEIKYDRRKEWRREEMKRVKMIVLAGVSLGIVLLVVRICLGIDSTVFMRNYWMAAPFLVVGIVAIYVSYQLYFQKQMQKLTELLKQGKANEYIDGMKKLKAAAKGKNLQNILTLNLAAGYVETKQYDLAVTLLENLSEADVKQDNLKIVYCINLCMSYFGSGKVEEAKKIYEENQRIFEKYRDGEMYGDSIAELERKIGV